MADEPPMLTMSNGSPLAPPELPTVTVVPFDPPSAVFSSEAFWIVGDPKASADAMPSGVTFSVTVGDPNASPLAIPVGETVCGAAATRNSPRCRVARTQGIGYLTD